MQPELQAKAVKNYYQRVYGSVRPPATEQQIAAVERKLGCHLPAALRSLYLLCDGFSYPDGTSPLMWVEVMPKFTEEFWELARDFAPAHAHEYGKFICFGYEEGLRYLAMEVGNGGRVVTYDPSLERIFLDLGPDLLSAYKNLEKWRCEALKEKLPPEEYWQIS